MLVSNLWVDMGLVNGELGTVKLSKCYQTGGPLDMPLAFIWLRMFDKYYGPTLHDGLVLFQ